MSRCRPKLDLSLPRLAGRDRVKPGVDGRIPAAPFTFCSTGERAARQKLWGSGVVQGGKSMVSNAETVTSVDAFIKQVGPIRESLTRTVLHQPEAIDALLTCCLCNGHGLLVGVP